MLYADWLRQKPAFYYALLLFKSFTLKRARKYKTRQTYRLQINI